MKNVLTSAVTALLLAAGVLAQVSITGRWQGATKSGTEIVLDLNATETVVTGTMTRGDQTIKITDGKVSKNTFTFKATINDQTDAFSGEVAGDEIKVWPDRQGPDRAAVLKRVKK